MFPKKEDTQSMQSVPTRTQTDRQLNYKFKELQPYSLLTRGARQLTVDDGLYAQLSKN